MSDIRRTVLKLARKAEDEALKLDLPKVCENCRFSHLDDTGIYCRKQSPTMRGFPKVTPVTWCGTYKVKLPQKTEVKTEQGVDVASPSQ